MKIVSNKNQGKTAESANSAEDADKTYSLKISQLRQGGIKEEAESKKVAKKKKNKRSFRVFKRAFLVFIAIFCVMITVGSVLAYQYVVIPALSIRDSLKSIQESMIVITNDLSAKNIGNLSRDIKTIRSELASVLEEVDKYDFLQDLELTKGYYDNVQVIREIVEKTDAIVEAYLPKMESLLSVTGFVSFPYDPGTLPVIPVEEEDADGALSLVLGELPSYISLYKEIEPSILDLFQTVKKLDPNYIPVVQGLDVSDDLEEFNKFADDYPKIATEVLNILAFVPALVGSEKPTTYLLYLQNEAEMRSAGGLLSAFGHMTVDKGEITDLRLTDSWEIEVYVSYTLGIDTGNRNIYGQRYLMNNGCGSDYLRFQDAGLYPDLNWTMNKYAEYYDIARQYNPSLYPAYDQMLILNFAFAQNLLSYLQPLNVEGFGGVTGETLFDFIKAESDSIANQGSADRKDIIEKIATAIKEKLFNLDISEVDSILKLILNSFYARDLALASKNPEMQLFFDNNGMSGRFDTTFDDDYTHINEAQNCALKLNKFLRNSVNHIISIYPDGSIDRSVRVNWVQAVVYQSYMWKQYDPTLQFSYRAWVRLITPPDVSTYISDGRSKSGYLYYNPVTYYDDIFKRKVSDNIIQFDHRRFSDAEAFKTHDLTVGYSLPARLNYNTKGYYRILLQKHAGKSNWETHTLTINHAGQVYTTEVTLDRDKVVAFKDGVFTIENYDTKLDWIIELLEKVPFDNLN